MWWPLVLYSYHAAVEIGERNVLDGMLLHQIMDNFLL